MNKKINLLEGSIFKSLFFLALPIVLTYFVQMAYNLIDMFWIGRLGSSAVAAVGVAGMFTWFSNGLITMAKIGGQVKIGHSIGSKNTKEATNYLSSCIQIGILFAAAYSLFIQLASSSLIDFFHLSEVSTVNDAVLYMRITCGLVIFPFMNQIFTASFNVNGDSRTPFFINTIGLVTNLIADPFLIFGLGPFPAFHVEGAAIATVFSQCIVFILFLIVIRKQHPLYRQLDLSKIRPVYYYQQILKIGFPLSLQDMLFSCCSMIVARFITNFGDAAIAAQKIGTQIESLSWMASDGFMAAINAFTAQNYGARQFERVKAGYRSIMKIVFCWGTFCSLLLILFPAEIFSIFLQDASVLPIGINYLRIVGFSQLFMCAEITTAGAFGGLGNTYPSSIESILLTSLRIPMIMIMMHTSLGLNGIWLTLSITAILKGIILVTWYLIYLHKICDQ